MSLDLRQLAERIDEMADRLKVSQGEKEARLQFALGTLRSQAGAADALKRKIAASKTTWLVAGLVDGLDRSRRAPPCPPQFAVLAVDGSHIDVDRHSSTRCYLINIGVAHLHYGENPDALLFSQPGLYFGDEELVIADPLRAHREELVEGGLLGIKRSLEECRMAARLLVESASDEPTLALLDGSLILWGLGAYPEFVTEILLDHGLLKSLDEIKECSRDRNLALASYISRPRSADVVNALRVALCPHDPPDCDRHCSGAPPAEGRTCDAVAGVQDRELFDSLLSQGERTPTFISHSKIQRHYRDHEVHFFYLKVDDEIARVEVPRWVAEDGSRLDLVHSLILDQCRRGQGYPVALSEAHERAVVTSADRERFWQLVELALSEKRLPSQSSAKSRSKRTRWV